MTLHEVIQSILRKRSGREAHIDDIVFEIRLLELWKRPSDGAYPELCASQHLVVPSPYLWEIAASQNPQLGS